MVTGKSRASKKKHDFLRGRSYRDGQGSSDFLEKVFKRHRYFVYFLWECLPLFYRDVFHFKGSIIYSNKIYNCILINMLQMIDKEI